MRWAIGVLFVMLAGGCGRKTASVSCRAACPCKNQGLCFERGNDCVAGADDDCKQSDSCKALGRCTLRGDECAVTSDADCRLSSWCDKLGRCRAQPVGSVLQCVR